MRYLITKFTLFLLALLVSSCAQDELTQVRPSTNDAVLSFTLPNLSDVEVGAQTKTAKNDFEKKISNMHIYIVEATEGESAPEDDAAVLEHYDTYSKTEAEIFVKILSREDPCWVVALVNMSDDTFAPATYSDIKNLSQGLRSLYVTAGGEYANELPMFGQQYFPSIKAANYTLELLHICSRIDVVSVAENFTLESVTLINGATKGHFVPQSPMVQYTGTDVTQYQTVEMVSGETALRSIYLFENSGGTSEEKNYTDVILGGKYVISTDNEVASFIKVKMVHSDPLTADIVRNTLYKLTLLSVNKSNIGYGSIEEAKAGEYSDAKIKIDVDLDAFTDLVVGNGDYYMSLSNSEYRAFIPSGAQTGLTAVSIRFNKNSSSDVDMTKVKKNISLGANSQGITIVGGAGDKTTTWGANKDIAINVDLADNAQGTLIVRIGNLVKEVQIVREQNDANFATAFNDDNYIYAEFTNEAPEWLKISSKTGTPSVTSQLYSEDGFKLGFSTERDGSQSAELYLSRSSDKGRTKVYVEQYRVRNTPEFNVSGLSDNTNISYAGASLTSSFAVSGISAEIDFLDESHVPASSDWEAEFSYDNGATWTTEKPEWIDMPASGTDTLTASTIKAAAQPFVSLTGEFVIAQAALRTATPKGSAGAPYNLANGSTENNDSETTANSYLVGASGTYKLPLVYGNAKKNGSPNSAAYSSSTFVDYNGNKISAPNITGASSAILCWQDAPNLVTDVHLSGNYLVFTVPQETITEGNAVVAIRDGHGTVMWSWHIWFTNYTSASDKKVYYQTTYTAAPNNYSTMMNVNLGWCSPVTSNYGENSRTVKVRLKQAGGAVKPSVDGVTYTQQVGEVISMGNNPYYQYGRKDPMLPSDGSFVTTESKDKYQSGDLQWAISSSLSKQTLANTIKNPNVFYKIEKGDWCSTVYNNLWSANNTGENIYHIAKHVKTVYDPSPVGYVVPPTSYFTGFKTNGVSGGTPNGAWNTTDKGWDFYCGLNKSSGGEIITFLATGGRSNLYASLLSFSTHGFSWSASPSSTYGAYTLCFLNDSVDPSIQYSRSQGYPVRPVQE